MRYLKLFGTMLVALLAVGAAMASSAFALPDVSLLPEPMAGEVYPIHLQVTLLTVKTKLSNSTASLTGEGLLLLFLSTKLSSLGTFEALFLHVKGLGKNCNTPNDKEGEVLTHGAFHIVPIKLSPLEIGVLYEPEEIEVKCGSLTIHIKGSTISSINHVENGVDTNLLGGELTGDGKGHATLTHYFNDSEGEVEAKLLSNFGLGFQASAEEVEGEVKTHLLLPNTMFQITGI